MAPFFSVRTLLRRWALIFLLALTMASLSCVEKIETSTASCPCADGWYCCGNNICAKVGEPCPSFCGDAIVDAEELCDDGANNRSTYSVEPTCNTDCTSYAPYCGDGVIQQGNAETDGREGCDPGSSEHPIEPVSCADLYSELGEGSAECNPDCSAYDTSSCENKKLVFVPSGKFQMGCNEAIDSDCNPGGAISQETEELPYHWVSLDAFVIDKHEATAGEYKECVETGPCEYNGSSTEAARTYDNERDQYPINMVNQDDAATFCEWRNMRLPTEAEWEKAARGVHGNIFPWGNELANCQYAIITNHAGEGCGLSSPWKVGSKTRGVSPYGAFDMAGNVFEWVADWFDPNYYEESPTHNPQGPESGIFRVIRGGSWYNADYRTLRASYRLQFPPNSRNSIVGFRCARSVPQN